MNYENSTLHLPEDFLDIFTNNLIDEKSKGGGKSDPVVGLDLSSKTPPYPLVYSQLVIPVQVEYF